LTPVIFILFLLGGLKHLELRACNCIAADETLH